MDYRELKNFGIPMNKTIREAERSLGKWTKLRVLFVVLKNLGILGMLRLPSLTRRERNRISGNDLSVVRAKGLEDQYFINYFIERTAVFSAMSLLVGEEQAVTIHEKITELVVPTAMASMLPTTDQIKQFDDPMDVLRKYIESNLEANREAGLHEYRLIDEPGIAVGFDITYCAFAEIPKQLGVPKTGTFNCYSDEVFFPNYLKPLGLRFVRTGTIARGNEVCDFRFERIEST